MSDACVKCGEEWNPQTLRETDGVCPNCLTDGFVGRKKLVPFSLIPAGFQISMLVVLVDEKESDIQTALSNELQKNKVFVDEIINIESNSSQCEGIYGYIKIVVWYSKKTNW
jgi:hypothetical protein